MKPIVPVIAAVVLGAGAGGLASAHTNATAGCSFPQDVQTVTFSQSKYPTIYRHWQDAEKKGWPQILVLDRIGASGRRAKLLASYPTKDGLDRDEYPPASSREGWLADVEYVPSAENRSQGASLGSQYSKWCDGVRFQYQWGP